MLTARLRDAQFFWDADRKTPLEDRLDRLHTDPVPQEARELRDKAERIERWRGWIAGEALGVRRPRRRGARPARWPRRISATDMVFEFTELQGTMGGIYAREEGLPEAVWKAIYYHYLPVGVEADAPPSRAAARRGGGDVGGGVAGRQARYLVVGCSRAGERPTGSRDPFGLRRQAHGAVRILVDLPELTGIDRAVALGPLPQRARRPTSRRARGAAALRARSRRARRATCSSSADSTRATCVR